MKKCIIVLMLIVIVLSMSCTRVDYKKNRTVSGILVHASNPYVNSHDLEVITLRWEQSFLFSDGTFEKISRTDCVKFIQLI